MTNVIGGFGLRKTEHYKLAVAFVACLSWTTAASNEPVRSADKTQYAALQSFSQNFGSKYTREYFVSETGKCFVTLTVAQKRRLWGASSDQPAEPIHLFLDPGQMAGLDSEEGQSVTFTCAKDAVASLLIAANEIRAWLPRNPLLQTRTPPKSTGRFTVSGK